MLGEKIAKYFGEVTLDTVFINTFNSFRRLLKSEEFKDFRLSLVSESGLPFGLGLADEAGFMTRAAKALDPDEFSRLANFLTTLDPMQRTKFRCSVVAVKFIESRHTDTTGSGDAKIVKEHTVIKDPAHDFLKLIASSKLTNKQRKKICEGLGLLDFPDLEGAWEKIDGALSKSGDHINTLREKMEAALLPRPLPANAKWHTRFFHWAKNIC